MNDFDTEAELLQLPDQVYQARCAALEAERRFLTADRQYDELRSRHYLSASEDGASHYQSIHQSAARPDVVAARATRDYLETEYKITMAVHNRLLDRLKVLLAFRHKVSSHFP